MARQHPAAAAFDDLPAAVRERVRPPVGIVVGHPADVVRLLAALQLSDVVCYQMDLFVAERLRQELAEHGLQANVVTAPDLWDLPGPFQTLLYPTDRGSERILKLDMMEQAYHLLRPGGALVVWSGYDTDQFFPGQLKKLYGKVHSPQVEGAAVFWSSRGADRPRRRHEVTYQCRIAGRPSQRFVSRPGTFSYGRFDEGSRALVETALIHPGDRILDLGCGCGTNGVFAAQQAGPTGSVVFVDSNLRAVTLAEANARANGVAQFQAIATARMEGLEDGTFDLVLANPPYFAQTSIAWMFIERSARLLKPGGRFSLVTRQPAQVAPLMADAFGEAEVVLHRGYTIFCTGPRGDEEE